MHCKDELRGNYNTFFYVCTMLNEIVSGPVSLEDSNICLGKSFSRKGLKNMPEVENNVKTWEVKMIMMQKACSNHLVPDSQKCVGA